MSTLEKWNPFRFLRRTRKDREEAAPARDRAPAPAPVAPYAAVAQMVDAVLRDPAFLDPFAHFGAVDRWFGDFTPSRFGVTVDVVDEGDALRVDFELPGMTREDVTLTLEGDTLVLTGQKQHHTTSREEGVYRSERYFGAIRRAVPLPRDLDFDAAEARFQDGVLGVRFPKKPLSGTGGRTIPVR